MGNEHFDKQLIKELVWKLDRDVWANVHNPNPSNEWTTSKAREETTKLLKEYLGDVDALRLEIAMLKKENEKLRTQTSKTLE